MVITVRSHISCHSTFFAMGSVSLIHSSSPSIPIYSSSNKDTNSSMMPHTDDRWDSPHIDDVWDEHYCEEKYATRKEDDQETYYRRDPYYYYGAQYNATQHQSSYYPSPPRISRSNQVPWNGWTAIEAPAPPPPCPPAYAPHAPQPRAPYMHSHHSLYPRLPNHQPLASSYAYITPPPPTPVHRTRYEGPPPRKIFPEKDKYIREVNDNDVLCGRGAPTNFHPGNQHFREVVASYQSAYIAAKRADKPEIALQVVHRIEERGGRFLKRTKVPGLGPSGHFFWQEIGEQRAYEKACQALREGAPEIRKSLAAKEYAAAGLSSRSDDYSKSQSK
jgi:hypothetical protein